MSSADGSRARTRATSELSMPGTAYLEVDGRHIRMRSLGRGEPVLLLHGIGCSLEDWNEQFDLLVASHRLIALDLPGFGFSDRLDVPATLPAYADLLPRFLSAAGVDGPVHLVGNSLGGAVAMQLAAERPELVASLALLNSAGFGRDVTLALRLLAIRPLGRRLMTPNRDASARAVRAIFTDSSFATEERVDAAFALASRQPHATTLLEVAQSLGTVRGVRPRWRRELLGRVAPHRIPTLLVWGERDRILPATHLAAAARLFPQAEVHLLPRTGHMPQIERADEIATLLESFLDRNRIVEPSGTARP